ncbi:MAG TPA: MBL fold metallo-hydrolase [Methylotenera sp.]|nr:MBL fold metallo-hydrolase [Methylotenera sp.]
MKSYLRIMMSILFTTSLIFCLIACSEITKPSTTAINPPKAQITVLYDAFGKNPSLQKDWGYAALIEYGGKRILFDTGDNPDILAHNVKMLHVDLSKLDFVVMSHRHSDHMGGLNYLLGVNPKVKIYAPKENFGVYGFSLPSTFYRKDTSLPAEQRYYDGKPPEIMKFGTAWPNAHFELIEKTTEIAPGIHLIFQISDKPTTIELRELSLAMDTPEGVVLVVGCSHPGLDKIVDAATRINKHIHMVTGGFHQVVAKDTEIEQIVSTLHDTFKVDLVAPSHCTGEPAFTAFKKAFGVHYIYAGLGTSIELNPNTLPDANLSNEKLIMGVDELRTYRALLSKSDEKTVLASGEVTR